MQALTVFCSHNSKIGKDDSRGALPQSEYTWHMWLVGSPNPSKIEQGWECTFLNIYTHVKTK